MAIPDLRANGADASQATAIEDKTDLERDTSNKWRFEERSGRDGW